MRILSIDPGVERVGIAILEKKEGKEHLVHSECFKTSSRLPHNERLTLIGTRVEELIQEHNPKSLAIEKLFFEKNTTTAMAVSEAKGVIVYEASKKGLVVFEYTPLQIKVAITGYGKSDKKAIMDMVPRIIQVPSRTMIDDEVDAIAIGLTCFAHEKNLR